MDSSCQPQDDHMLFDNLMVAATWEGGDNEEEQEGETPKPGEPRTPPDGGVTHPGEPTEEIL